MAEARASFQYATLAQQSEAATLGMWAFLATEILFFGALIAAYSASRLADPAGIAAAARHTNLILGTLNTAILLTSSAFMATAVEASGAGRRRAALLLLAATCALGLAFLAVKGWEYRLDYGERLVPALDFDLGTYGGAGERFFLFYFLATGLHAVHLTIGILLVAWLAVRTARSRPPTETAARLTGLYWHFVDIVWIFLFPLIYLVGRSG
jgi:cytochrome c oxidase subunit 3